MMNFASPLSVLPDVPGLLYPLKPIKGLIFEKPSSRMLGLFSSFSGTSVVGQMALAFLDQDAAVDQSMYPSTSSENDRRIFCI